MRKVERVLVVQTAFLGDVILTLPLIQVIKDFFAPVDIDVVVVPRSSSALYHHPAIRSIVEFDKKGTDRGWKGLVALIKRLRQQKYDLAFIPHRSLRSALLAFGAGVPIRVGFAKGIGQVLHSKRVRYQKDIHEVERNLSLLEALGIHEYGHVIPDVYPSQKDADQVDDVLARLSVDRSRTMVAIAPGTVWNTKRWLKERFAEVAGVLAQDNMDVMLVGGENDRELCAEIRELSGSRHVHSVAGDLSVLQSAELIRRCKVLVCNDSAPLHLGVAVKTPVVAIFGATVPAFGFGPLGVHDAVVETRGLRCRPCSIHGGDACPIKTFECMKEISAEKVLSRVLAIRDRVEPH